MSFSKHTSPSPPRSATALLFLIAGLATSTLVQAANQTIQVGGNGTTFNPANITADVGDVITFEFHPMAHTVTQSTFVAPCTYLNNETAGKTGFDSGLVPTPAGSEFIKTMAIQIDSTEPLWFFCKPHCGKGMVGSINAVESGPKNFAVYQQAAIASGGYVAPPSTNSTTPGATPPTGGGPAASLASGGPAGAASTVSPTVTTPSESGGASGGGVLSTAPSASGTVGSAGQISSAPLSLANPAFVMASTAIFACAGLLWS